MDLDEARRLAEELNRQRTYEVTLPWKEKP